MLGEFKTSSLAVITQVLVWLHEWGYSAPAVPVTDPAAIGALTRAFTLLLRFGGDPVAVPIAEAEAAGFPLWRDDVVSGGVAWLAVGIDSEGPGMIPLHSDGGAWWALQRTREFAAQFVHRPQAAFVTSTTPISVPSFRR